MVRVRLLPLLIVAISLGCAPPSSSGAAGADRKSQLITQQEISAAGMSGSAYEVISRLRPSFLVSRGQTSLSGDQSAAYPNVYLDGVAFGDLSTLRNIDASQIAEIRMYQSWEAQTKFGLGNSRGVIAIITRR
ncbi:MAG TPA: hypothetical protein VES88_18595 [Gemmatimonadaceae bacterium]|nr:hypothetical protein [Gemmatimonadaceae bacterium]